MLNRRTLLTGILGVIAAPAIVRASSLMPVKAWRDPALIGADEEIVGFSLVSEDADIIASINRQFSMLQSFRMAYSDHWKEVSELMNPPLLAG